MDNYVWTGTNAWTDCSLSHLVGHEPFTRSHCVSMYHVTYQLCFVLRFSVRLSAYVVTTLRSFAYAFSRSSLIRHAPCRGEHGQDQDWISCRILAIFLDQDWIWVYIFEKN